MLADGIRRLYDLVNMLQPLRKDAGLPPITTFDIGGGLPISYLESQPAPDMREYVKMIMAVAPELFPDFNSNLPEVVPGHHYRIITEFGRWVFTNPGWTVSRVEYVKHDPGINTAMLHVGADLFVRECLNPADWKHEYSVFNAAGKLKEGYDPVPWNLAGPLCFSGDIIAKNVMLPPVEPGDYIAIHDTGGYTFSMWSRYNSRQTPRILGYRDSQFEILKERESLDELLRFWD
jgi:diaminopimelate decarboxylase